MRTINYKLGEEMGHDIQIIAQTVCRYDATEYNGKKWPARRHIHILADIRLADGSCMHNGESDLLERAVAVYNAMRDAYSYYPDGEVEVSLRLVDHMANL